MKLIAKRPGKKIRFLNKQLLPDFVKEGNPEQNEITGAYTSRMTITPYTLHMCQKAVLIITGKEKLDLLISCLEQPDKHLPINHAINILKSKLTILATL